MYNRLGYQGTNGQTNRQVRGVWKYLRRCLPIWRMLIFKEIRFFIYSGWVHFPKQKQYRFENTSSHSPNNRHYHYQNNCFFFPVRGHIYQPADHIFGRAEKLLRKKSIALTKQEYYECCQSIGQVKVLGKDWNLLDTKSLDKYYKNLNNISDLKRIAIKIKEKGNVAEKETSQTKKKNSPRRVDEVKSVVVKGIWWIIDLNLITRSMFLWGKKGIII